MAGECGRAGMAQSHSCCQPSAAVDTHPLVKAASPTITHSLVTAHQIPSSELIRSTAPLFISWTAQFHDPPGETPPGTTVLRI
jgi:hypothetical protein